MKLARILLLLVLAGWGAWLLLALRPAPPVGLTIVGQARDASGAPVVVFQVTNHSSGAYALTYETQVKTTGPWTWYPAESQRKSFRFGQLLPGNAACTFSFGTPAEGAPWRVVAFYGQPPGTIRAGLDDWLKRLGVRFRVNRTVLITPPFDR